MNVMSINHAAVHTPDARCRTGAGAQLAGGAASVLARPFGNSDGRPMSHFGRQAI